MYADLTVRALKDLLATWPETDHLGEPSTVWMMTGNGLSSPVTSATPLNTADILFSTRQYEED